MELVLKIQANEIEQVHDMSYYNHVMWKFKNPQLGLTHVAEIYDDVNDNPDYELGCIDSSGKFVCAVIGYGDPIVVDKIGVGGVWFAISIQRPDLSFKIK